MGRSKVTKRIAVLGAVAATVLLLASCPLDLRTYVEWLKTRDTLIPIEEIFIASAGDDYQMGDGIFGPFPTARQRLTYSFVVGKYEVTNAQFKVFMDQGGYITPDYWTTSGWGWLMGMWPAPANRKPFSWDDPIYNQPSQPVVGISWFEAVAYCNWRSTQEGLTVAYTSSGAIVESANGYRLPTLVEREYAAAKGDRTSSERIWPWGDTVPTTSLTVFSTTAPLTVGSKSPAGDTPQGLADMSGNAVEWCSDNSGGVYVDGAIDAYHFIDGGGATGMVLRGGAYSTAGSDELRNSNNMSMASAMPGERFTWFGFRTVRRQ